MRLPTHQAHEIHRLMVNSPFRRLHSLTMHRLSAHADGDKTYTQAELDAILAEKVGELDGLKRNTAEALREKKALAERLKAFDGLDVDKAKTALSKMEELEQQRLKGEGDWKSLEAQLLDKHGKETEKLTGRIGQLTKALEQKLVDAAASAEIAELKGSVKGLLPHVKPHIRMIEQDGEFLAVVVDGKGNPRIADAKGTPMTIKDLVGEFKNDAELGRLFEGSGSSGGGASRSSGGAGGQPKVIAPSDLMANVEAVAKGQITVQT